MADRLACHCSAPAVVLGFNALQLSDDRDPLAPHAEALRPGAATLRSLLAGRRLAPESGVGDCLACHRSAPAVVLGFNALQLSDDRDPLAPHAEPLRPGAATLRSLLAGGRLAPRRTDLALNPPRIRENDPIARA